MTAPDILKPEVIHKARRTELVQRRGLFTVHINAPGRNIPGSDDHGRGPLALVVESTLEPGTHIRLHEHTNDEIISWVPDGVMRHNDPTAGELTIDAGHMMVMNAGSGFWHEERVLDSDPHLRMLQIIVRPRSADLPPGIQYGELSSSKPGKWRHLFSPEGAGAPFFVRNDVHLHDIRLRAGKQVTFPADPPGWNTYFYVFTGAVTVGGVRFGEAETGLAAGSVTSLMQAETDATVVCFLLNPAAAIVRSGTVGR